jgi:lipopolysaccharide/colanic/teichoic acid biosynthesis glycosyltransferase
MTTFRGLYHERLAVNWPHMKRIFDFFMAAALLVLLVVPLLIIACLVRFKLGAPVLFRQQRPGRYAKPFKMLKFRTMVDKSGPDGELLPDSERLTAFGCWLRSTSLDELPELWNVLCGEMSFVGPRPLLMEYLPRYSSYQARRHEVRPGITGWAQVNGRNNLSWPEKFDLDVWYVDNRSFRFDVYILLRTIASVIKRDGINADGEATMASFMGNDV